MNFIYALICTYNSSTYLLNNNNNNISGLKTTLKACVDGIGK